MWQAFSLVEKDLRLLSSFFYCDLVASAAPAAQQRRYAAAANALNACRGAVSGIRDAETLQTAGRGEVGGLASDAMDRAIMAIRCYISYIYPM